MTTTYFTQTYHRMPWRIDQDEIFYLYVHDSLTRPAAMKRIFEGYAKSTQTLDVRECVEEAFCRGIEYGFDKTLPVGNSLVSMMIRDKINQIRGR